MSEPIISIAGNQAGDVFMAFETIFRLDAQGALVPFVRLPGNTISEGGFAFGPDSALYAVVSGNGTAFARSLYRIGKNGAMTVVVPEFPGASLAILPDLSMYFLNSSPNVMTRRSTSGEMQQVLSYPDDDPGTYPRRFRGLLFNPADSALYWMFGSRLIRRDLRSGTNAELGDFGRATPVYVDSSGNLYLRTPFVTTQDITFLTIIDRDGVVIGRRYPPAFADGMVIRGDTIFGLASGMRWILPPR